MKRLVLAATMLSLAGLMTACANIQPSDRIRAEVREVAVAEKGDTVHLFYGMSKEAKEEFCPDAVVPVYRLGDSGGVGESYAGKTEVGKIKVVKNLDDNFIEAVVEEGTVRAGDIAMQARSGCMIKLRR